MGIATNVLGILKLATGAARIGRGGSTVDADLTTLENGQTTLNDTLTAEAGKVATLQRQVVPLARAVRVAMTGASSGSRGIMALDNVQLDNGTNDHSLFSKFNLADVSPSTAVRLDYKYQDASNYTDFYVTTGGNLRYTAVVGGVTVFDVTSTAVIPAVYADGAILGGVSLTRETASSAGSAVFYIDASQLGDAVSITAAATVDISNTGNAYFMGTNAVRSECSWYETLRYNRALSSTEVLSLAINGPDLADVGGTQNYFSSQSNLSSSRWTKTNVSISEDSTTAPDGSATADTMTENSSNGLHRVTYEPFTAVAGRKYTMTEYVKNSSGSRFVQISIFNNSGVGTGRVVMNPTLGTITNQSPGVFGASITPVANGFFKVVYSAIATSTGLATPSIQLSNMDTTDNISYVGDGSSGVFLWGDRLQLPGITAHYNAAAAQSDTGQVFDSSGNGNHAVLPPEGATIIPQPQGLRQVRSTLTWSGDSSAKYLVSNQDILPEGAEIERVTAVIEGTPVDGTLGDSADNDRYCTLAQNTGLIEGSNRLALAERTTDGTNRELLWTPSAAFTGTIKFTIHYFVGEQ